MRLFINKETVLLITIGSAAFLTPFSIASLNVALPSISKDLSMNTVLMSLVLTSFLLVSSIFLLPFGYAGDNYSKKTIFIVGVCIFTFASFISAISQTSTLLIIARSLCGFGSAMILSNAMPILVESSTGNEKGKMLGVYSAFIYAGLTLGAFAGGYLTQVLSWRWIFFIILPIGLISLILSPVLSQPPRQLQRSRFDIIGFILYAISLFLIICGLSTVGNMESAILLAIGFLLFIGFVIEQLNSENPLIDLKIFVKNRTFSLSMLSAFTLYISTFSFPFVLSLYLQFIEKFNVETTGLILIVQPILMSVISPFSGRLSDKIQPRIVTSLGIFVIVISFSLVHYLKQLPLTISIITLSLLGMGFGMFSSPNANAIMGSVDRAIYGVASATLSTIRTIGQTMSMALVALIFSSSMSYRKTIVSVHDISIIFLVSLVFALISLIFSLLRGNIHRERA